MIETDLHLTLKQQLDEQKDNVLRSLLFQEEPSLLARYDAKKCSIIDLVKLQTFLDLHSNIVKNNVLIALRLCGGLSLYCKQASLVIKDVEEQLNCGEYAALIPTLSQTIDKPCDWFQRGRVFYSEKQLCKFRGDNLAILLPCISNYKEFLVTVNEKLSPCQKHLTTVLAGKHSAHSSRICRQLESLLNVENGMLDLRQSKFEVKFHEMI